MVVFVGVSLNHPFPISPVARQGGWRLLPFLGSRLPVIFAPETSLDVCRRIEISMGLIATRQATEQFATAFFHGFSASDGEPLPFRPTSRTVLARSMRVRFYRDDRNRVRLFFAVFIALALNL